MVSTTFYYHLFIFCCYFWYSLFGYIDNKVLYDINPYFETEATQHLIPILYFDYQNCSLTFALSKIVI